MATQIARVGSKVSVEIPEELLRKANLAVGDPVEWTLTQSGVLALRGPNSIGAAQSDEEYEEWKLGEIRAGLAEAESGETVPHRDVAAWLRSWGTPDKLPPPL